MQFQTEDLTHENEQLAGQLQTSMKNRKLMESLFTELQDDYEVALSTIERLENKVQELKDENLWLGRMTERGKELHGGSGVPSDAPAACAVGLGLHRWRNNALSQSLFSVALSVVVGTIVWEAADPCVPLICALFIIVGMSLTSTIRFFSTIKNRPATVAVPLLSLNWFVLGALASATLPHLARLLAGGPAVELAGRALRRLGLPV